VLGDAGVEMADLLLVVVEQKKGIGSESEQHDDQRRRH
jgi:hypothetical protein